MWFLKFLDFMPWKDGFTYLIVLELGFEQRNLAGLLTQSPFGLLQPSPEGGNLLPEPLRLAVRSLGLGAEPLLVLLQLVGLHHQHLLQLEGLLRAGSQSALVDALQSPQLALPDLLLLLVDTEYDLFVVFHGLAKVGEFGVAVAQCRLQFRHSRVGWWRRQV